MDMYKTSVTMCQDWVGVLIPCRIDIGAVIGKLHPVYNDGEHTHTYMIHLHD